MRLPAVVAVALTVLLGALRLSAQGPWIVTIKPVDPLPIGTCGSVLLSVFDPSKKGTPRSASGHYVSSVADFDMAVESAGVTSVVGKYESASIWSVCACQSATVGSTATITATYPATALPANSRVAGTAFKSQASFKISAAKSAYNPPGCIAPKTKGVITSTPVTPAPPTTVAASPAPARTGTDFPTAVAAPMPVATSPTPTPTASAFPTTLAPPVTIAAPVTAPVTAAPVQVLPTTTAATGSTVSGPALAATARMTNFKPTVNGFQFVNTFINNFLGQPINMETSGLCGGMTYTVLDYYYNGGKIPNQDYRPANGTILQTYLYGRQVTSLLQNGDRWIELSVNPFGSRTLEFFNWGISGQLTLLRSYIDRGVPVPLGLKGSEGNLSHDHQVLAIGYDVGRYLGDLGQYKEDVKLYIFDPNFPNQINTLVPDPATLEYHYVGRPTEHWRTYFVDGKYAPVPPPNLPNATYPNDSLIHELLFEFETGPDDMRGGADHVDVKVKLTDNTTQYYPNISQNGRWLPFYNETARVVLTQPVAPANIQSIEFSTNATGGINGDNWDMVKVWVTGVGGNFSRNLRIDRTGPNRFSAAANSYLVNVRCCFW